MSATGPLTASTSNNGEIVYVTYRRRYIGLLAIVLLNLSTGFVWLTYSSAADAAQGYLNCSNDIVNLTSIIYFIAYVIMGPVSGYMFEKYGIKKSLLFGSLIQVVGAFLRYFANFITSTPDNSGGRLALTMVGQLIAASAQPFFLNVPPKYAAVWFSEKGRTTATMIGSVSNALAAAVAQLVIPVITTDADSMVNSVLFTAILSFVCIFPILLMQEQPPTPPSPAAAEALAETNEDPFWVSLKKVGTNKQFLILMVIFGSFVGFFNAFSTLISQFTKPYGYTAEQGGYFGAAMIVAGLVGAGISGPVVDKNKKFKPMLKAFAPVAAALYVVFVFVVRADFFIPIIIVSALLGVVSFGLLPIVLELGVECTYPVTPSSSTSLLWGAGQLFAVVFLFILGALQDDNNSANPPLIFIAAWTVAVCGMVYFFNSPYKRMEAEARYRQEHRDHYETEMQQSNGVAPSSSSGKQEFEEIEVSVKA